MTDRTRRMQVVSRRLLVVTLISLVLAGTLFGATLVYGKRFMMSWAGLMFGIVGGFVSIQRRLTKLDEEELTYLSESWTATVLAPIYGGLLAGVLYFLFLSGLLQGQLFPEFSLPAFANPPTTEDIRRFLVETYPKSGADLAKFMFWSFVGGFSERFVPSIIQTYAAKNSPS